MIDHLQTLVSLHPTTNKQNLVKLALEYAAEHFKKHGLHVTHLKYDGVYNLYASTRGQKHSRVLLQSHIDVVPGKVAFEIKDDTCYGRGVYDMLFAVASYMQLVDDLKDDLTQHDFAIMLSGDEEKGGFHGSKAFLEDGYSADVCILPDAGERFGSLSVAAKGMHGLTIRINGRAHHGSRPWEGDGAAGKLVACLNEIQELFDHSDRYNSTLTISQLQAGMALNQGPALAEAGLDIRYKNQAELSRIQAGIDKILKKYDGEITHLVSGSDYQLDVSNPLVQQFMALYETHTGMPVRTTRAHGSSDARHFCEKGIPVIMCRPDGGNAHGEEEWLSLSSLAQFYGLLKEYVITTATTV